MRALVGIAAPAAAIALLAGCASGAELSDVSIVVDGEAYTLGAQVTCTRFANGNLLIYASPSATNHRRSVRVMLGTTHRLVVKAAGFRIPEAHGFTKDSGEMTATKVDDDYTISGRMPDDARGTGFRHVKIEVTCPGYQRPNGPPDTVPQLGSP
ncbi:lipoprotein LpqH [Mycolicibacterium sp. HK-90]|uniref:lipoprotein LpqH n=1 Tax=Mycolicibacterium sp. HK-90 TaxID=3056937 RepID=UPI002658EC75|nr:lipoprotein LpqH [Mycolicibacterium sp. HK-90]WKG02295.1 lipoprotein LpqH [Mycolicibacterium sp. HK-90]